MYISYKPLELVSAFQINSKSSRYYTSGERAYPSVTQVLSATKPAAFTRAIAKCKAKNPEVVKDWAKARERGTLEHLEFEFLVKGKEPVNEDTPFYDVFQTWESCVLSEVPVCSDKLGFGGTVDALVRLNDGSYRLIDYKTSYKRKTRSQVTDYFVQLGFYKLLLEDVYKINIPTAQILMLQYDLESGKRVATQVFDLSTLDLQTYCSKALDRLEQYNQSTF